eukprot:3010980-Alexandrium_andersonii.AAC.1
MCIRDSPQTYPPTQIASGTRAGGSPWESGARACGKLLQTTPNGLPRCRTCAATQLALADQCLLLAASRKEVG